MAKVLLIGHAPAIGHNNTRIGFAQLRTWSLHQYLQCMGHSVELKLISEEINNSPLNIPAVDAVITAGPFASAHAALSIPDDIPLWMDWPSDPRADLHARIHTPSPPTEAEKAFVQILHQRALFRADAIGVISKRQYWASISSLMDTALCDPDLHTYIHVIPIAYDFPFPEVQAPKSRSNHGIALCGSMNSWFDSDRSWMILKQALQKNPTLSVHVLGGSVPNHPAGKAALANWKHQRLFQHGWVQTHKMQEILQSQHMGFWINKMGVEPLLGSRTRAMLFAWMGMDIAASCDTELMATLHKHNLVWDIRNIEDLSEALRASAQKSKALQDFCRQEFLPKKIYQPIHSWLKNPKVRKKAEKDKLLEEYQRLHQELHNVHSSRTWKWAGKAHKMLLKITKGFG